MKITQSKRLWSTAKKKISGGNMLLSKRPDLFSPEKWPAYFSKAKGCYVWDLDGNKYLDFSYMGVGTNILGYANSKIDNFVINRIKKSVSCTLNCPEEVELANKLLKLHKWADQTKFARTGAEANAIALRLARAYTKSDKVAFCGYHGWHDWYISTNLNDKNNLNNHLLKGIKTDGVVKRLKNSVFPFRYNKIKELEILLKKNIKIIFMEVKRNEEPKNNFLKNVRKLANKYKAILIFDECTSGFRETCGGLHLKYKVNPDIAVFGKALGNGYAITAVLGKKKVMKFYDNTFMSSTFWSERIGPTAAIKTLEIMDKDKSWLKICKTGKYIKKKIALLAHKNNISIKILGLDSIIIMQFDCSHNNLIKTFLTQEMLKRGFLSSNLIFISRSHNGKFVQKYLENLSQVFEIIGNNFSKKSFFKKNVKKESITGLGRVN